MTQKIVTPAECEALALELAQLAGAQILASLGRSVAVRYKALQPDSGDGLRDPVSEIDQAVEVMIRARLAQLHADHDIVGEEIESGRGDRGGIVWVIDPVDGTTNFVNGFPLFAASIGVLDGNRPIAGAMWCSTSHRLRAGVYHASEGSPLSFDGMPVDSSRNAAVRRRIVGLPEACDVARLPFEVRQTGSAAVELALVAAGLLAATRLHRPNLWDVAGGVALVLSSGGTVLTRDDAAGGPWEPFRSFSRESSGTLWRRSLIAGDPDTCHRLAQEA